MEGERTAVGMGNGGDREEGNFGLRGYQCVSSLQNECPRFLPRGLYHVATIHAPTAAWLLAERNAEGDAGGWGRRGLSLSLISRSVNNKNIDITRVYQCAAAFEVHFAFEDKFVRRLPAILPPEKPRSELDEG